MPYHFTKGESNDVIAGLIGVIDIITGILVYLSQSWSLISNPVIMFLTFFYSCLGIWSLATNVMRRNFFDWRGVVDIISAISLISIFNGNVYSIFGILGIIIAIKGIMGIFLITTKE